ncbi:hypothetical protein GCM10023189_35010 [Nibrella saemangeumensis]|uniref:Erythromycin esterase homolog n=1 Tax=Nibrella saemangeumensis TaxID=1084526 RepID=A0ABP8N2K8_9BACT
MDIISARTDESQKQSYRLTNAMDLDPLLDRIGDARCVMLGEASHGTHEYYTWRTAISKRLIQEKGFTFIAVEGDWPDSYQINRFVKGYPDSGTKPLEVLRTFDRWPTWMWANWEIAALMEWLKSHNTGLANDRKVGFYGLDVYSLWESMESLVDYLEKTDPEAAQAAHRAINCFQPYGEEGQNYAQAILYRSASCRDEVIQLLREIRTKARYYDHEPEASLNIEQNAHIAVNAEKYYRSMISFSDESWNIRDAHMMETLNRLRQFHGSTSKAIVWEHNTHIGDARYTDMKHSGMINIGQLAREQYSEKDVVLVGFGSYQGTVIAGNRWGAPMEVMTVPSARKGSVEERLHAEGADNKLLIFDRINKNERFSTEMPHRAIGVVYHPERERYGNYVPTVLNHRYDAFIYLDQTRALHPLHLHPDETKMPETYPFGF